MKYKKFKDIQEFLEYLNIPENCTISIQGTAYFEFHPYINDLVIIRGWIESVNKDFMKVSFKYREFDLGCVIWTLEYASKVIEYIDYYYEDYF